LARVVQREAPLVEDIGRRGGRDRPGAHDVASCAALMVGVSLLAIESSCSGLGHAARARQRRGLLLVDRAVLR
jgi:hypothetical protein